MSLSNDPTTGMIAPYVPAQPASKRVDDFSFQFGEGESLKGIWSVIRKRKKSIWAAGFFGASAGFNRLRTYDPAISRRGDYRSPED